jgi:hypothetical protein
VLGRRVVETLGGRLGGGGVQGHDGCPSSSMVITRDIDRGTALALRYWITVSPGTRSVRKPVRNADTPPPEEPALHPLWPAPQPLWPAPQPLCR